MTAVQPSCAGTEKEYQEHREQGKTEWCGGCVATRGVVVLLHARHLCFRTVQGVREERRQPKSVAEQRNR